MTQGNLSRKLVCLLLVAMLVLAGTALAETKTIKIGTTNQTGHPAVLGLQHFADLVEEYTNGSIKVEVYPDGQLGNERDLVEGCQLGTTAMAFSSSGPVGAFAPKIEVLNLPYLFRDLDHVYAVLDGEIGAELAEDLLNSGLRSLAYWENGWRQMTNSKRVINSPEDMVGLKIRVMESPIMVATINAMGGSGVPMGWSEVITSLQQGIIDGQENPIINNVTNGAYEVQDYLSLTRHFYNASLLLINEDFYQSLTDDERAAINRAAIEGRDYQRALGQQMEAEALATLEETFGLTINYEPDIAAFTEAVQPVYDEYADSLGGWDLINKIKNYGL